MRSCSLYVHDGSENLGAVQDSAKVDVHDIMPSLLDFPKGLRQGESRGCLGQEGRLEAHRKEYVRCSVSSIEKRRLTHVVHQDRNLSMQIKHLLPELDHLVELAHIRHNSRDIPRPGNSLDTVDGLFEELRVDIYHDDVHAGRGEVFGCGETDSGAESR